MWAVLSNNSSQPRGRLIYSFIIVGEAGLAHERRARCCQMSDDEPNAEGLLLSPQQLHNVFRGLSNNTLSGL